VSNIVAYLEPPEESKEVLRLRREIVGLEQELTAARGEAVSAKQAASDAVQAIRVLRGQLEPFYTALKMVFGEISRVSAGGSPMPTASSRDTRWESWKRKLGMRPAEIIDVLLEHGMMSTSQLAAALHRDTRTINRGIFELNKASLINKKGGKFSLKEL
jgi:hypothetical protein